MNLIEFHGVSKTFGGRTAVQALAEVELAIRDREFVALLGP